MQSQEFSVLGSLRVQVTDVQEKKKKILVSEVKLFSTRALQRRLMGPARWISPRNTGSDLQPG